MSVVRITCIAIAVVFASHPVAAQKLVLPPEVTPALRAACEKDVRRLCISENATVASVKTCVVRRYTELSMRCKVQIAAAGLSSGGR